MKKWRDEYNVVLLWIEKAEDKQNQREDGGDDLDKLKKQRKKLEVLNSSTWTFTGLCIARFCNKML